MNQKAYAPPSAKAQLPPNAPSPWGGEKNKLSPNFWRHALRYTCGRILYEGQLSEFEYAPAHVTALFFPGFSTSVERFDLAASEDFSVSEFWPTQVPCHIQAFNYVVRSALDLESGSS